MRVRSLMVAFGLTVVLPALPQARQAQPPPCDPASSEYICEQSAPEDLVIVPGGGWVVASMFTGSDGIQIISTADKTTTLAYPGGISRDRFDSKTYNTCPGAP